jgi:hypothetical protein
LKQLERYITIYRIVWIGLAVISGGVFVPLIIKSGNLLISLLLLPVFIALFSFSIMAGNYANWLGEIKKIARGKVNDELTFFIVIRSERIVVKMTFERFLAFYNVDQKNRWRISYGLCSYQTSEIIKEHITTYIDTDSVYVYFSFLDYLKFKRFMKENVRKARQEMYEETQKQETEQEKKFIECLKSDVNEFRENAPFKDEEE